MLHILHEKEEEPLRVDKVLDFTINTSQYRLAGTDIHHHSFSGMQRPPWGLVQVVANKADIGT